MADHLDLSQFEPDDDDWYIQQCAHEHGEDPFEVVQRVRRRQAGQRRAQARLATSQGDGGGNALTPAGAEAVPGAGVAWPPGFAGTIAQAIYRSSYSPVREVAITAAIALLAGVCGRPCQCRVGLVQNPSDPPRPVADGGI